MVREAAFASRNHSDFIPIAQEFKPVAKVLRDPREGIHVDL